MNHKDILKQGGKEVITLPIYERGRNTIVSGGAFLGSCLMGNIPLMIVSGTIFGYNLEKSIKLKFLPIIESTTHWGSKVDTTWLKREMNYQKVKIRNWRDSSEKY